MGKLPKCNSLEAQGRWRDDIRHSFIPGRSTVYFSFGHTKLCPLSKLFSRASQHQNLQRCNHGISPIIIHSDIRFVFVSSRVWHEELGFGCLQALIAGEEFQHILRVLNTNVDGRQKIMFALTSIKGVGRRFANLVCKKADVDMSKRYLVSCTDSCEKERVSGWLSSYVSHHCIRLCKSNEAFSRRCGTGALVSTVHGLLMFWVTAWRLWSLSWHSSRLGWS